jgi:hypothetical protein
MTSIAFQTAAVPEPGSLALVGIAATIGCCFRVVRRKRRSAAVDNGIEAVSP